MAKLYFRYGTMSSGKSALLMQTAYNYEQNGKHVIVIKPKIDTKAADKLESRIGLKKKVDILIGVEESLMSYYDDWEGNVSCILVDEAQFLTTTQVNDLWYVTKILDIPAICYGLKTNFQSELFEGSKRLLELSDDIEELSTICSCGKKARFNARFVDGEFTLDGNSVLIDGSVSNTVYKPMCGKCYLLHRNIFENKKRN